MSISSFCKQAIYRFWQFQKAVFPELNQDAWNTAIQSCPQQLVSVLNQLGKAEKAHTLRVLKLIKDDVSLENDYKNQLLDFALLHDIGKAITKPSLIFKIAKVLFKLNGNAHCIEGAKVIWRKTRNLEMAKSVLRHHQKRYSKFISDFQQYDDQA